jgi:outer membrane lipoprotein-sorting protein
MTARWLIVLLTAAALIGIPVAVSARPSAEPGLSPAAVVERIDASSGRVWSGLVETSGNLSLPDSDSFVGLAQLLGEDNDLRVWWRAADDWRIDRIRSTGETDLIRSGASTIRWVFESETATVSPVSEIRLPDASDLLPPTLTRLMLQGVRAEELSALPARRVAGIETAGVRLRPAGSATSIAQVDIWADRHSGLPLRVELYGVGDRRPVLRSTFRDLDQTPPPASATLFRPSSSVRIDYEDSVDVAAEANALAAYDLPDSVAGLGTRDGQDPGAVGVYGRGPTTLLVLPLRGQVARPLRQRLRDSGNAQETTVGTLAPVGPVGLLLTPRRTDRSALLLTGTVTGETLERAASELLARS